MGTVLNGLSRAPSSAATQWIRAASHAESADDLHATATGIALARHQSGLDWDLDDQLCAQFVHASDRVREAIGEAGLSCSGDPGVDPGYWVHNLEHGAIVLLYRCPAGCPGLVASLGEVYDRLPAGHNDRRGPRMLITAYDDMNHPLAIIAWGHRLELDQLEVDRIIGFYTRFVDRGPECRNLLCPD